jgi:nucleoside-diphosphate-sugar epimerase
MRVLVTGAAGRIGRAVVAQLNERGAHVTGLVLDDPGDLDVDTTVVGDAGDGEVVRQALRGVDAVIHLAAIPTPDDHDAAQIFATNTQTTFTVLEQAGAQGIRRVSLASSYSATGMSWARQPHSPPTLPLTVGAPSVVEDPYSLSKQVDELTATMMARRHGMAVVALRYPFIGEPDDRLTEHAAALAAHPELGARELWSYLETRDAAAAALLAITAPVTGAHVVYVAAPRTIVPYPTEALLARFHPASRLVRPMPGRTTPIDLEPARELLGFSARFELEITPTDELPAAATNDD